MRWMTCLLFGLACASLCLADERPNILYIISDDQSWGDYSFMGHPHIETPHIDKLASQSLTFTRGYVPTSLCRPSLVTMVTGLYPHQHKITGNDPIGRTRGRGAKQTPQFWENVAQLNSLMQDLPTLPKLLGDAGYLSFQTGKWWEGHYSTGGFTHGMSHGEPTKGGRLGDDGLKIGRDGLQPIYDFIQTAREQDKPFLVWYAPFLPHEPHNPPQRLLDKYMKKTDSLPLAKYWAMCEWLDETCGELLGYLDREGLARNTIVVYVTDNGWIQNPDRNGFLPGSKQSPYDRGIRTPIMLRWPGKVRPRRDEVGLASSVDLVPTLLAACGVKPTPDMQGINLLDAQAIESRSAVYGALFLHDVPDMQNVTVGLRWRWIVEGQWKLILPHAGGNLGAGIGIRPELYHITTDPHERHNRAFDEPGHVIRLIERLDQWWPVR